MSCSIRNHIIENASLDLATAEAHIQCGTGNMQLSFSNMNTKLNIFNIAKQPPNRDEGIVDVDVI